MNFIKIQAYFLFFLSQDIFVRPPNPQPLCRGVPISLWPWVAFQALSEIKSMSNALGRHNFRQYCYLSHAADQLYKSGSVVVGPFVISLTMLGL